MENKIDIVITMGGLGSRFRKMGYQVPKYMIEAKRSEERRVGKEC